jgi:hypothetical protein
MSGSSFLASETLKTSIAVLSEKIQASPELALAEDPSHPRKWSSFDELLDLSNAQYSDFPAPEPREQPAAAQPGKGEPPPPKPPPPKPALLPTPFPIRLLALLSLASLFADVCPAYRIQTHSAQEVVNKELRKLRQHEGRLLRSYQRYLKQVTGLLDVPPPLPAAQAGKLRAALHRCLCHLCLSLPGFNFSSSVLAKIVAVEARNGDAAVTERTRETMRELFRKETADSLPAVKAICGTLTACVKASRRVPLPLLEILQSLPLRIHSDEADAVKAHQNMTKKQRKRKTEEERAADADLAQSAAVGSKLELALLQSEMLQLVTTVYFRLLRARGREALPAVLRGVAKITPLLNIDAVVDVLKEYKEVSPSEREGGGGGGRAMMKNPVLISVL